MIKNDSRRFALVLCGLCLISLRTVGAQERRVTKSEFQVSIDGTLIPAKNNTLEL